MCGETEYKVVTYTETNGSHDNHGQNVQPGMFQPLTECRPRLHRIRLMMGMRARVSVMCCRVLLWGFVPRKQSHFELVESHSTIFKLYKPERIDLLRGSIHTICTFVVMSYNDHGRQILDVTTQHSYSIKRNANLPTSIFPQFKPPSAHVPCM